MAASLNKVMILGRLGRDPDVRQIANGTMCHFSVATDESYNRQDGTKVEATEWHSCVSFGKTADLCARFLHKGSLVLVEGSLATRKYTGKDGSEKSVTEIRVSRCQFCDSRPQNGGNQQQGGYRQQNQGGGYGQDPYDQPFPSEPNNSGDGVPF